MSRNLELTIGEFEWDIRDGEVRFSIALPADDGISERTFITYFNSMIKIADELYPELNQTLESLK